MIRVGIIGVGNMGTNHLRVYKRLPSLCEVVGIYDPHLEKAKALADKYKTTAYDNMDKLLDRIDAVSIVVPSQFHYEVAQKALLKGKHILIEKPITTSIGEAKKLINQAVENGNILQVGHIERFNPAVRELKKILENEQVLAIDFKRMSPFDPRISEADVIQDLMTHDIDIVRYLFPYEEFGTIQASGTAPYSGQMADYVVVLLELTNKIVVSMSASRITEEKIRRIDVHTKSSFITVDLVERKIIIARRTSVSFSTEQASTYRHESIIERVYVPNYEPLQEELESFLNTVQSQGTPIVTGEDGLFAVDIVERIRKVVYK